MIEQIREWATQYVRSVLNSIVRVAVVSSTNPARATVRVKISDDDGLITYDLHVLMRKVHEDKDYWMPDIGDHVLCLFLPFGLETGFVVGSFYSSADKPPVQSQDKFYREFKDGTYIEYDRSEHVLTADVQGAVNISATKSIKIHSETSVQITAPRIDLN